MGKGKRE